MGDNVILDEYKTALEDLMAECRSLPRAMDYDAIIRDELSNVGPRPFASVIVRTQGKRPEGLNEALLGLFSQSCQDFEVVLIGHKLDVKQKELVQTIIDNQPKTLKEKIRFFELDIGGRTVPLNFGFSHARGDYAIILDDDDIVFENWVEVFKDGAQSSPGKIIHSETLKQYWSSNDTEWGVSALRAESAPTDDYCKPYDAVSQTYLNNCPPITLAFPLTPFREQGIIFDESLDCVEDWDYLMRIVMVTGLTNVSVPTSIYRWWCNAESSQTVCSENTWVSGAELVRSRAMKRCYVVSPSEIEDIVESHNNAESTSPISYADKRAVLNSIGHLEMAREMYVRIFGDKGRIYRFAMKLGPHLKSSFRIPRRKSHE